MRQMGRCYWSFVLLLAFSWLGMAASFAAEKVWVGLYLAENSTPSPDKKRAPEKLNRQLEEIFGFSHYELISADEIELSKHWEQWVVPRKDFFIRLEPMPKKSDEARTVNYEIYKDGFIVARGTYEPHEETPLFINGPDFKQGRFIFVLEQR